MEIQIPQILFQMINFFVVTGALTFLLYKPVRKMLEERSNRVEEAQKAAELTLAEKKNIDEIKRKAVVDAHKEAAALVAEAKRDAVNLRSQMLEEAKKAAAQEIEKQRNQLTEERANMVKDLKAEFMTQVIHMTEKVLGEAVDQKSIAKKLDKDIEEVIALI